MKFNFRQIQSRAGGLFTQQMIYTQKIKKMTLFNFTLSMGSTFESCKLNAKYLLAANIYVS